MNRSRFIRLAASATFSAALVGATAGLASPAALAQSTFPSQPIKLIVGASPGGTTDTLAREVGQEVGRLLRSTVIVENRAGAGGNIAADAVAKAAPDGYTLLMSFTSHTINASLFPKLPFDSVKDFTPISMVATGPSMLVAHPSLPVNSVQDVIDYGKRNPGKLNFALGGVGSSLHLATEQFKMVTGVDLVNVPYKGTAPALADVLAGHVPMMFAAVVNGTPQVKSGKIKLLAVTGTQRMKAFPHVPTVAETVPGFESLAWWGILGPAKMPADVLATLNGAIAKALESPVIRARLQSESLDPVGNSSAAFADFIVKDIARYEKIVKATGAKPE